MEKITIEEFRRIKAEMKAIIDECFSDEDMSEELQQEYLSKYVVLEQELLSYDLSDIPFEEWEGIMLFSEDELDFSKTHANLDFEVIDEIICPRLNIEGCNIRNFKALDYTEETFSPEYRDKHPEFFPSKDIPEDVRELFYSNKLTLGHIYQYPELRNIVIPENFSSEYRSNSYFIISKIGLENTFKLLDEYPEFMVFITGFNENDNANMVTSRDIPDPNMDSYEDCKRYVFNQFALSLSTSYVHKDIDLSIIPDEFREQHPDMFVDDLDIEEGAKKLFYEGKLHIRALRYYKDKFKDKNIKMGTRHSYEIEKIEKIFGNVWTYFEKIPEEFDIDVVKFIRNIYSDEDVEKLSHLSTEQFISLVINNSINGYGSVEPDLNRIALYTKYVPIEQVVKKQKIRNFIVRFGIDKLIEFNNSHDGILDSPNDNYWSYNLEYTLLGFIAEQISLLPDDFESDDLVVVLEEIIRKIRLLDNHDYQYALGLQKSKLRTLLPKFYIDIEEFDRITSSWDEEKKKLVLEKLEYGIDGNLSDLVEIISNYPELVPLVKKVEVNKSNWRRNIKDLDSHLGSELFLDLCIKYGIVVSDFISRVDSLELEKTIEELKSGVDIEETINSLLYRRLNNGNNERLIDIRMLPESFKAAHPELYLGEDAPKELEDVFYGVSRFGDAYKLITPKDLVEHPEWIPYLLEVDLSKCLDLPGVDTYNSEIKANQLVLVENMAEYLRYFGGLSNEEILKFIVDYGQVIPHRIDRCCDTNAKGKESINKIKNAIYLKIKDRSIPYNDSMVPQEFIDEHPDVFLSKDAPEELKNVFYQRKIAPSMIQNHPEWIPFLEDKFMYSCSDHYGTSNFVKQCIESGLKSKDILELFVKYGDYLAKCNIYLSNYYCTYEEGDLERLDELLKRQIYESIVASRVSYSEDAMSFLGEDHSELFLDVDAPEELKKYFYNYGNNNPLTFQLLKEHREWLPFLKGKNVLLSLEKKNIGIAGLEQLFSKYGDEEAIRIGMKNPTSVMQMLSENKFDILSTWYDKLHFVPHHVVMRNFPVDQIDKFAASGKKWSQLSRIEEHNRNDEGREALLKAAMCFGVFDNDMEGYNKMLQLFSGIPKKLTPEQYEHILKQYDFDSYSFEELGELSMFDFNSYDYDGRSSHSTDFGFKLATGASREEFKKIVDLMRRCYKKTEEGYYTLTIDPQIEKEAAALLRKVFEKSELDIVLTPDKAHKLFGGFEMKYDPSFRDFIMDNMALILSSDEYISYISAMQKRWTEIKAFNSNRNLTLDLALSYIKTNRFINVSPGNERLAVVSSIAGYDQDSFDKLQKIYNYGKSRTYSSIPRVTAKDEEFSYEILRLDDPLCIAIGTLSDCCQELGNAAESSMEHSTVDKNGRVFVIKDMEGNIVAQSWVWRNKNVVCFDNIEIPDKAFNRAAKAGMSREEFADRIFALYKKAAEEIIKKDEEVYKKLLEEEKITQEEYDTLRVRKVTVGQGYNDIKNSLDRNAKIDQSEVSHPIDYVSPVTGSNRLYTDDSSTQYVIAGEENVPQTSHDTLAVYADEYEVKTDDTMTADDLISLKKLEIQTYDDYYYGSIPVDVKNNIVSSLAYTYDLDRESTRVVMNANFAIIYDEKEDKIIIGELLYNININDAVDQERNKSVVLIQIRNAIMQINKDGKEIDISRLDAEQRNMYEAAMNLDYELDEERGLSHGAK